MLYGISNIFPVNLVNILYDNDNSVIDDDTQYWATFHDKMKHTAHEMSQLLVQLT